MTTFTNYPENEPLLADLDMRKTAQLCTAISTNYDSTKRYINENVKNGVGFFSIIAINKSKTWAIVRYTGYDTDDRYYDGQKIYYCKTDCLIFDENQNDNVVTEKK